MNVEETNPVYVVGNTVGVDNTKERARQINTGLMISVEKKRRLAREALGVLEIGMMRAERNDGTEW